MDSGSTETFISTRDRSLLRNQRPVHRATLTVKVFKGKYDLGLERFSVRVASTYDSSVIDIFAYERDFEVNPENDRPPVVARALGKFNNAHPLADRSLLKEWHRDEPAMLIGQDQLHKIMLMKVPQSVVGDIRATQTRLGWAAAGSVRSPTFEATVTAIQDVCCMATLSKTAENVERLWKLDAIGIEDSTPPSKFSFDDEDAVRQVKESLTYDGTCYTAAMPKKASFASLLNNLPVAEDRLYKKLRQLEKQPAHYQRYHEETMKFVNEGHAEEIADFVPGGSNESDSTYFMPHHAVITKAGHTV